jgi:hypothetical protein
MPEAGSSAPGIAIYIKGGTRMAIIGITIDRTNPAFAVSDFTFWMPQFAKYAATTDGSAAVTKIIGIANNKIFYSIYGTDWEYAMSLCVAHYLTLIGQQQQAPSGDTLGEIAGGGTTRGILETASIGSFSKSYDLDRTMVGTDDAKFWNQTSYGASLMALYKTKAVPSIFVVTSNDLPDA